MKSKTSVTAPTDIKFIHIQDMMTDPDSGFIIVCAVRYALGRQTYAVEVTINYVKKYWDFISVKDRKVILKDVSRYCDQCKEEYFGSMWRCFEDWMRQKIKGTE